MNGAPNTAKVTGNKGRVAGYHPASVIRGGSVGCKKRPAIGTLFSRSPTISGQPRQWKPEDHTGAGHRRPQIVFTAKVASNPRIEDEGLAGGRETRHLIPTADLR